jgi:DNA (cytosine-5)-methyltransferase 1
MPTKPKQNFDVQNHDSGEERILEHCYQASNGVISKRARSGSAWATTSISVPRSLKSILEHGPQYAWHVLRLRGLIPELDDSNQARALRIFDLFCGAGGFSQGLKMAAEAVGRELKVVGCADIDPVALDVYRSNLRSTIYLTQNIDVLIDYAVCYRAGQARLAYQPDFLTKQLKAEEGNVDIVVGGPPCQGHSNFNNHTRRMDPRNSLYLTVAAFGVAVRAPVIIIENVPSVRSDHGGVVEKARSILEGEGYYVDEAVLSAENFAVPQLRRRHFMLASTKPSYPLNALGDALAELKLTAWDAISDLEHRQAQSLFDAAAVLSEETRKRVDFLHLENQDNLPNHLRPECHRDGHSYPSVYGRMHRDEPAQTITGGFFSPGRGRFTHPTQRRGLTAHEAARLQGFPDDFLFRSAKGNELKKRDFSKLIGDAVPPPLAYAIGMAAMATLEEKT